MTIPPFLWKPTDDDIEDDAICFWEGMILRYEQMGERNWWWAVSEGQQDIAWSNDDRAPGATHHAARLLAEGAAIREWLRRKA